MSWGTLVVNGLIRINNKCKNTCDETRNYNNIMKITNMTKMPNTILIYNIIISFNFVENLYLVKKP